MSVPIPLAASAALLLLSAALADAAVVWDEESMGDLSNDSAAPTDLAFFQSEADGSLRANSVLGETDSGAADIFTFEIAAGDQLETLTLANYEDGDLAMFVGIASGNTFPNDYDQINDPFFFDTSAWLGGRTVGELEEGSDILALLGQANITMVGTGFTPPLGPGQYTMYVQQTGPLNLYTLDFNVASSSAVPEPSSLLAITALAVGGLGTRRLRSRRRHGNQAK